MIVTVDHVEAYLERLQARRDPSEHTIKAYRSDLRDYVAFARTHAIGGETGDLILAYVQHLMTERRMAIRTTRRRVASLRGFYADLVRTRAIEGSPFQALEMNLPRAKSLPRCLTREEAMMLAVFARSVSARSEDEARELAIAVLLLLSVGLRVGELVKIRPGDLEMDGGLRIRGKGRRERRVPVVDRKLRDLLSGLVVPDALVLFNAANGGWSTQSFRQRLRAFAQMAGVVRRVTPHMLRHTSATLLLEDGVDLLFLQRLLGHENIATTAIYAHVGDASLRRALERAHVLTTLAA